MTYEKLRLPHAWVIDLAGREHGQTLAELSMVLAFVVILCIVAVTALGVAILGFFTDFLPAFG